MCRSDERIKASVNLDGGLFGQNYNESIKKPIMILLGAVSWNDFEQYTDAEIAQKTRFSREVIALLRQRYYGGIPELFAACQNACVITIAQADHSAFSDWVLLKHLNLFQKNKNIFDLEQMVGKIDGFLMTQIVTHYVRVFFDKYLKHSKVNSTAELWPKNLVDIKVR
jgi:hypothetical protein